jgi:hypothetical protein
MREIIDIDPNLGREATQEVVTKLPPPIWAAVLVLDML